MRVTILDVEPKIVIFERTDPQGKIQKSAIY